MPFKIRTKLIIAFFAIILPFIVIGGILVLYSADAIHNSVHKIQSISEERAEITNLILAMEKAIMQANDYIITGDSKYSDDFYIASNEVEKRLQKVGELIPAEDRKVPSDAGIAWQNIKETALKIFAIPEPIGNKGAARLVEEMDYKWAYPAIERLKELRATYIEEFKEASRIVDRAWVHSWIVMIVGAFALTVIGIFFAFFYSSRFTRPIKAIHNGADVIAGGNFKTRLEIKTGDEIEQLSNAMNEMAAQLDSFYSNLQGMVDERTREVQESEKSYRSLFDNMLNGFAYCRMLFKDDLPQDYIYLDVNKAFEKLTGLKNVVGKKVTEVIPGIKEAHPELFEIYGRVALTGRTEMFEIDFKPLSIWLAISVYSPERGCFVAVFDNITERKKAEEALKESETRFRGIVETAKDAVVCIKQGGSIYLWNKSAEEIFGYKADEVINRSMHDVICPERYKEKAGEGFKGFSRTGAGPVVGKTIEIEGLKKDGTEFPVELSISAMNIRGEWHAAGIIRDITKRKEAEKRLAEQMDFLARFHKAAVQREFRIKELKDRVKELEEELKKGRR